MLFTTTNANSNANTGNVFGYVERKNRTFYKCWKYVCWYSIQEKHLYRIYLILALVLINIWPLNYTGKFTHLEFTSANITFNMAVYKK